MNLNDFRAKCKEMCSNFREQNIHDRTYFFLSEMERDWPYTNWNSFDSGTNYRIENVTIRSSQEEEKSYIKYKTLFLFFKVPIEHKIVKEFLSSITIEIRKIDKKESLSDLKEKICRLEASCEEFANHDLGYEFYLEEQIKLTRLYKKLAKRLWKKL